jgi:hypothetical protein
MFAPRVSTLFVIALRDLYGVDFDRITDKRAAELNRRIFENYRSPQWLISAVEKANIRLLVCDNGSASTSAQTPF